MPLSVTHHGNLRCAFVLVCPGCIDMTVHFPVYRHIQVDDYQLYPGSQGVGGISHSLTHGLHLVAGVNGLGKSTLLLMLYHGIVGPAAIRNDDFGVPQPETIPQRLVDRFRRRVADGARTASLTLHFSIGSHQFEIVRCLHDLSIQRWTLDDVLQETDENDYTTLLTRAMNLGSFFRCSRYTESRSVHV